MIEDEIPVKLVHPGEVVHAMLLGLGSGFVALLLMLLAIRLLGYSTYLVQVISITSLALIPAILPR